MPKLLATVVLAALAQSALPGAPFQPWGPDGYRTINAIEFSPDGQSMFIALETARVAKIEGRKPAGNAAEIALYESRREGDRPRAASHQQVWIVGEHGRQITDGDLGFSSRD